MRQSGMSTSWTIPGLQTTNPVFLWIDLTESTPSSLGSGHWEPQTRRYNTTFCASLMATNVTDVEQNVPQQLYRLFNKFDIHPKSRIKNIIYITMVECSQNSKYTDGLCLRAYQSLEQRKNPTWHHEICRQPPIRFHFLAPMLKQQSERKGLERTVDQEFDFRVPSPRYLLNCQVKTNGSNGHMTLTQEHNTNCFQTTYSQLTNRRMIEQTDNLRLSDLLLVDLTC